MGDPRVFVGKHDVTRGSDPGAACVGAAFDQRHHRFLHAAYGVKDVTEGFGIVDMLLARSVEHVLECREIRARAKRGALAVDGDDPHRRFTQREQSLGELIGGGPVERVFLFGAGERNSPDRALDRHSNVFHLDPSFAIGSPRCFASLSGTSMIMRRSAVEYTFPCASVLSDSVPPPSSAPWSRKLSALRFGSS